MRMISDNLMSYTVRWKLQFRDRNINKIWWDINIVIDIDDQSNRRVQKIEYWSASWFVFATKHDEIH
jgi:hypothetical protein